MKARQKLFNKYFKKNIGGVNHEVLDFINGDYERAVERAKQFLQIENETVGGPITISVPESYVLNDRVKVKKVILDDKTSKVVYNQTLLSVVMFGEHQLYYYQANLDHRTGLVDFDVAGQVPYQNITHIQHSFSYDNPANPHIQHLEVELNLADGFTLPFRLRNRYLGVEVEEQSLLTEQEEKLLNALYAILR